MARRRDKVTVRLDARMVERIRAELAAEGESDAAVVERALNAYLLGRLLERTQAAAGLSEEDAERVAYEELHAAVEHDPPGVSAEDIRRRAGTRPATPEEIASFHEQFGPFRCRRRRLNALRRHGPAPRVHSRPYA